MSTSPVFIVGTERSGSNLVRLILDAHPNIAVPHPPHWMNYFGPLEASYGPLTDDAHLGALLDDMLRLLKVHIHPWELHLDRDRALAEAQPRDALGLVWALYDQFAAHEGKPRWGNKSTFMVHYIDRVLARDPGARFVWLIRDPRDVAVSSKTSVFNPWHPWFTGALWAGQQQQAMDTARRVGPQTMHGLHYEALLADPEGQVRALCEFLGEHYDPNMLRFFERKAAKRIAKMSESWQNASKGILKNNSEKWRRELTEAEVQAVERAAGPQMSALGYTLAHPPDDRPPSRAERIRWTLADQQMRASIEWRSLRRDDNHWRRWARGSWVSALQWRARLKGK